MLAELLGRNAVPPRLILSGEYEVFDTGGELWKSEILANNQRKGSSFLQRSLR
jgi:hypothetical protein